MIHSKTTKFRPTSRRGTSGDPTELLWEPRSPFGSTERKNICFFDPKLSPNGTKMEPKSMNMWQKNDYEKRSNSRHSFSSDFLWFWSYFWIDFSTIFMICSKNLKKGRHAFRLRHGERIEGRTYQNRAQIAQESVQNGHRKTTRPEVVKKLCVSSIWEPILEQKS